MTLQISVITPNFNGAETLRRTIESVLGQDAGAVEHIVVDGGSTDGSSSILEEFRSRLARVVSEPDHGQYDAIAKGAVMATGDILCWVNSDDALPPWALRIVGKIFHDHSEIEWITGVPCLTRDDAIQRASGPELYPRDLILGGAFHDGGLGSIMQECTFWRRSLYEKAGGLNPQYKLAGDFDLWTRFARHAPLVSTTAILGSFTWTGKNRSLTAGVEYAEEIERIRSGLDTRLRGAADRLIEKKRRFESRAFKHPWARSILALPLANEHHDADLLQFIPETGTYKRCVRSIRFDCP